MAAIQERSKGASEDSRRGFWGRTQIGAHAVIHSVRARPARPQGFPDLPAHIRPGPVNRDQGHPDRSPPRPERPGRRPRSVGPGHPEQETNKKRGREQETGTHLVFDSSCVPDSTPSRRLTADPGGRDPGGLSDSEQVPGSGGSAGPRPVPDPDQLSGRSVRYAKRSDVNRTDQTIRLTQVGRPSVAGRPVRPAGRAAAPTRSERAGAGRDRGRDAPAIRPAWPSRWPRGRRGRSVRVRPLVGADSGRRSSRGSDRTGSGDRAPSYSGPTWAILVNGGPKAGRVSAGPLAAGSHRSSSYCCRNVFPARYRANRFWRD